MKKILGILAVTLIVGAPVFAANTATITYTLQAGGNNGGTTWTGGPPPVFDTTGVVAAPGVYTVDTAAKAAAVTWSVRVAVTGAYGPDGSETVVGGAANLVWDLKLKDSAGNLVSFPSGLGSATTAGFYSSIMNGSTRDGTVYDLQAAAFPWVFDVNYSGTPPYGRIIDIVDEKGPHMAQCTYPNTYGFVAASTAESGTLMGMGAGYKSYELGFGTEKAGVGLASDSGLSCYQDIGARPIAEGQINMLGLPNGTYTLELIPGKGNNAIWVDTSVGGACDGSTGAFAVTAAAPKELTSESITIVKNVVIIQPPALASLASKKTHSGPKFPPPGTFSAEFSKDLPITTGAVGVECRDNTKATKLVFTYDKAIAPTSAITATATNAVLNGANGTPVISGNTVTINLTSMTNKKCVSVTIAGACDAAFPGNPLATAGAKTVSFKMIKGDVTGNGGLQDGKCDAQDVTLLRARTAGPNVNATNFWLDVDQNGSIGATDVTIALTNTFVNVPPLTCSN